MSESTTAVAGDNSGRPAPDCGHWIGAELRYCRSIDGLRYYIPGHRCRLHTPAALMGIPEPEPGPGWPSLRTQGDRP